MFQQIEGKSHSIRRSFDNGTKTTVFIGPRSQPYDIAIDIIGRLLFWTCANANTINVTRYFFFNSKNSLFFVCFYFIRLLINKSICRLDGQELGVVDIGDSEKPRSIAVHSMKRLLFWTDVGSQQSIYRSRIDGADRLTLAIQLDGIAAIAVDQDLDLLFYAYNKRIDVMDLDGRNK